MTKDIEDSVDDAYKKTKAGLKATKNKLEDSDRDLETEYKKEKVKEDVKDMAD